MSISHTAKRWAMTIITAEMGVVNIRSKSDTETIETENEQKRKRRENREERERESDEDERDVEGVCAAIERASFSSTYLLSLI